MRSRPRNLASCLLPVATGLCAMAVGLPAQAIGHGPTFGLATPTLPEGATELDGGGMLRGGTAGDRAMFRGMYSYGLTPDVMLSLSAPVQLLQGPLPAVRGLAMMPVDNDVEGLVGYRFLRREPAVGERLETTAYAGGGAPLAGTGQDSHLLAAVASGYVSRTWYLWGGLGYQARIGAADRPGDASFASLVLGYRPPAWQLELPHPDARLFLEALGEHVGESEAGGVLQPGTGASDIMIGPSTLVLWGNYGFSAGILFPVYQDQAPGTPRETFRLAINGTYFL